MDADVNSILLAWEGRQEADDELYRVIYQANGIKLPEKPAPRSKADMADRLKAFAKSHNEAWKPKPRAGQRSRRRGKVPDEAEQG